MKNALLVATCLVSLGACGDNSKNASGIASECNPLGGVSCLLPFPSSTYLTVDEASATGLTLDLPIEAMPINFDGIVIDPGPWNRHDGFSLVGAILAAFPGGVSADGLPPFDDPAASLADASPILLVDMSSGERALFFAEVDQGVDESERLLFIRPLKRLNPATRYAVAIRDTVRGPGGVALERPAAFQALLDKTSFAHPRFAALEASYGDIFAAVEAHGVNRDELVLAWDFVTASDESMTRDMLTMRDSALPVMGADGANLTFEATEIDSANPAVHRLLTGTHTAPNFMTDGESDVSIIVRGADDLPMIDGMYTANFAAVIPDCVNTAPLPIPAVLFGHGLFGTALGSIDDGFIQEVADDKCFVIIGGDLIGLSQRQIASAAFSANDLNRSHALSEKLGQAVINFIALEMLMHGAMAESPLFELDGTAIIDTENIWYLGGSLGGTMGGILMAYDPNLELGALGVPGSNWSLLIERSFAWAPLQLAARAAYTDPYDYQLLVSLLAFSLERWDPITTATRVLDDPLPGTPAKQLLLYETLNDSLVTNLSSEMFARTLEISVVGPTIAVPFGLTVSDDPLTSGLTIYDENVPVATTTNVPPSEDNGTHSDVNERQAVLDQVDQFFRQRQIVNACGSEGAPVPCDCGTGACD